MHSGGAEAVSTKDDASWPVDIQAADELVETGGGEVEVGNLAASVHGQDGVVNKTHFPESNSQLCFSSLINFRGDIVGDAVVSNLATCVVGEEAVHLVLETNQTQDGAAVAMLRAHNDDTMRCEGACNIRIRVPAASQTMRKDHCRPSFVGSVGIHHLCILMDRDGCVVQMSRQKSGAFVSYTLKTKQASQV